MHRRTATAAATAITAAAAIAVAACAFAVAPGEGTRVLLQLTPAGAFTPNDGRPMDPPQWRIDAASAQRLIERFRARKLPPVIDYEHQTLHKEANGQPAPAAGWIRDLRWVNGQGLFAVAELTQRARQHVADGEYLYVSPVFEYDPKTGTVLAIHMAALTNNPAIHGMAPLSLTAAATAAFLPPPSHSQQEQRVNPLLKALLAALGLPETTTEETALTALAAIGPIRPLQERARAACTALNLQADAGAEAITAACTSLRSAAAAASSAGQPDPARYVPIAVVQELQTNLAALTARQAQADVDALIAPALADGRLLPAQETWARELGRTNLAALTSYLKTAQPIAALASTQTGGKPPAAKPGEHGLSAEEVAVAAACGITPEAFAKAKAGA